MAANNHNNRKAKEYALDKFDSDLTSSSGGGKQPKAPKEKNPFKRFIKAVFPYSGDSKSERARKIVLLMAIAVLIGTVVYLLSQLKGISETGKKSDQLASLASAPTNSSVNYEDPNRLTNPGANIATSAGNEEPEYTDLTPVKNTPLDVNFDYLKGQNPDTRAWIRITDTLLNHVVVQRPNDQDFYLNHDFNGNYVEYSAEIFSSWRNSWDGTDDNIILYGHYLPNSGYGFTYVDHYVPHDSSSEPLAFYKVHPTILFQEAGGKSETYKIFAGILANTDEQYGEVFDYTTKTKFTSADDFNNYMIEIMDRSWFYTDVDLTYGDKILTLSTCYWPLGRSVPTRFALFARKVRPGESEEVDTSVATRNWGAKLFEYYYDVLGTQWNGSTWDRSKLLSY